MTAAWQRLRIGIDTGGTFTDVVALDEATGALTVTKTPTTPANPARGFMTGLDKVLALAGAGRETVAAVSHGTTIATNQLLEGKVGELGFITTEGFEFVLEIARQSVPDGYGNSYFWVKPERIVPVHLVRTVGGRLDHTGAELRPFDEAGAVAAARWFRERGVETIGVCFLHSYANPAHEEQMAAVLAREHPGAVVSVSSQVLREYREYERSMTTLLDAAVKPRMARYLRSITELLDAFTSGELTLRVMKSNGGAASADEVIRSPITTVLSGPAAGALGAALIAREAGVGRVLTCDGGGTSTDVCVVIDGEPALTTEGSIGRYPSKIPMIDVVTVGAGGGSIAWISAEGALKVGPQSAGADPGPACYGQGGTEVTVTDAHLVLGRIPPHLLGGEVGLNAGAAEAALEALSAKLGVPVTECATGILEISAWNQANAVRQITVKRGLDVRDFTLVTFGGSGSLLACKLIDILGLDAVLVPGNPGNVSAFGLLTVDVRNDYVRTAVRRHADLDHAELAAIYAELAGQARRALAAEGFAESGQRLIRSADLRYFGQAFEVTVPVPDDLAGQELADAVAAAFHDAHRARYGYDFRSDPRQQVEWVSLRATGVGPLDRPRLSELPPAPDDDPGRARTGTRKACFDRAAGYVETAIYARSSLAAGDEVPGPAIIEEYGATIPIHPGFTAVVDRFGNLRISDERGASATREELSRRGAPPPGLTSEGAQRPSEEGRQRVKAPRGLKANTVLLEIIAGSLASIEKEVETAIGRTSRSPMIRDAHDFRAGIHDRLLRKLTGRSYSALVHPVARDFPLETMRPGDVFFHNDVYLSEGGIGHLPDLCVTVPVFHDAGDGPQVVAFVQAFGHHDDIGGAVPGSMPSHATSVFEEGLMVPPIRLWDQGVPNRAALTIMTRNSRMPDSLAADLDAECAACLMGSRRLAELFARYGRETVEACFDAIVAGTTQTYRREILTKIPPGTWTWEDYAEHDGVEPPKLHVQRITLTRTGDAEPGGPRLILDFNGTGPQAKGPINHCANFADGNFLAKWLAPILRNLADSPERMAELDVNEGIVDLIEMRFPPPGTLLTPVFPAPTNARTFVILRLLGVLAGVLAKATGGQMPADQETIRYTGVYGDDVNGEPYLMREVLGGGSGGRYYADGEDTIHVVPDSRNLPAEFSESRFPFLVERLGLAVDSGGAGKFRGGLGYEKHIRMLTGGHFMSIADRSILSCWGVNGGKAGRPFQVTIDPGGPGEREVEALADAEPVPAGTVIRIRTTGGGGWGDPLDRDPAAVARDVRDGKVSRAAAAEAYGVVLAAGPAGSTLGVTGGSALTDGGGPADPVADLEATGRRRASLRAARPDREPFFDRGPGYLALSGGATAAEVDWL